MRHLLTTILTMAVLVTNAQTQTYETTVVDAVTHERLPFASIFVDGETSTITNAVGVFSISCKPTDILRISFVGYKSTFIEASQLKEVVTLQPQEKMLQELVVVPIGPLIDKICKETLRLQRKYKTYTSKFFYRQTAFKGAQCYEFVESFLQGYSAVSLRELTLQSGRYAGLLSDSTNQYTFFGNFYTFSQLEIAATYKVPTFADDVVPLFRYYDRFYNASYWVISDDDGNRIFAINFEPKPEIAKKYAILSGTVYVDEKTLHIRRFEGQGLNFRVMTRTEAKKGILGFNRYTFETSKASFYYVVEMTEERGFPEVQSVYVDESHEYNGENITTRSLLFNLGEMQKKKNAGVFQKISSWFSRQYDNNTKGRNLKFQDELHKAINEQGYYPEFWEKNEIVRRTPIEDDVLRLFEQKNLFGVLK